MTFIEQAYILKEKMEVIIKNYLAKEDDITVKSVVIINKQYKLGSKICDQLYELIIQETLKVSKIEKSNAHVKNLKEKIMFILNTFNKDAHNSTPKIDKTLQEEAWSLLFNSKENRNNYSILLYSCFQDKILYEITKSNNAFNFVLPETTMAFLIAKTCFQAYYYNVIGFEYNFNKLKENQIQTLDDNLIQIFALLVENKLKKISISNITKKDFLLIKKIFAIENQILLNITLHVLLIKGLQYLQQNNNKIMLVNFEKYLLDKEVYKSDFQHYETLITENLTTEYIKAGSCMLHHFCEHKLFTKTLDFQQGKKHKQYLIKFDFEVIQELNATAVNFKPYIAQTNEAILKNPKIIANGYFQIKYENLTKIFHNNEDGKGCFVKGSNLEVISLKKLCIDNKFLLEYLSFIESIINKDLVNFNTSESKENLSLFLSIYGIDFDAFAKDLFLNKVLPEFYPALIKFALDFNFHNESYNVLKEIFKQNKIHTDKQVNSKSLLNEMLKCISKIYSYKLCLKNALFDFIIFSSFEYVLVPSFFDFRGRCYPVSATFNTQGYVFLKAFIKQPEFNLNELTEEKFNAFSKVIIKNIEHKATATEIEALLHNFDDYKNLVIKNTKDFLNSHFTCDIFEKILHDMPFIALYKIVYENIKKKTKTLMITSFIFLNQRSSRENLTYVNIYSYDCVISGYQNLALLSRDAALAEKCNLIGNDNGDLYQAMADSFYTSMDCNLQGLNKLLDSLQLSDYRIENETESLSSKEVLFLFLTSPSSKIISLEKLSVWVSIILADFKYEESFKNYFLYLKKNNIDLIWLLSSHEKAINIVNSDVNCGLFIARHLMQYKILLQENPWLIQHKILQNRLLFKYLIMVEIYGAKRLGRQAKFFSFMHEIILEQGIRCNNVNKMMKMLFYFIENFYQKYKATHLPQTNKLRMLGLLLSKKEHGITIINPNIVSTQLVAKKKLIRLGIRVRPKCKPYQLSLRKIMFTKNNNKIMPKIDKIRQQSKFPPNFIHSMDAMSVHIFMQFFNQLKEPGIITNFENLTTHDNFAGGYFLFPLVPLILRDIYIKIYNFNYIQTLRNNFNSEEEYQKAIANIINTDKKLFTANDIKNPFFVKYG